jgi:4-amino-4-deoxy-L-arabinose transferase-like glycosyltransferase
LISAVILSTTGLFYVLSGGVMTDPALAASITLSMVAFALALRLNKRTSRLLWGYAFFIGLGLSALAKGPVGCLLTLMPIFVWSIWYHQGKNVWRQLPWIGGVVLTLFIAVPWHILAEKNTPGFLNYYFVGEHWNRFIVSGWQEDLYGRAHAEPRGIIWLFAIPATLPWLIVLVSILWYLWKKGRRPRDLIHDSWLSYLCFWFVAPLIFFSLTKNILMTYVLPSIAPFALLTARALLVIKDVGRGETPWFLSPVKLGCVAAFVPFSVLIASFTFLPYVGRENSQFNVAQAFQTLASSEEATLIYTNRMPYSADFYTQGKAKDIPDESLEKALRELYDDNEDFFAIRKDNIDRFPKEFLRSTTEIGLFGGYILRRELNPNRTLSTLFRKRYSVKKTLNRR